MNTSALLKYNLLYGGVNISIPGEGGKECEEYISNQTRMIEMIVYMAIILIGVLWVYPRLTFQTEVTKNEVYQPERKQNGRFVKSRRSSWTRKILILLMIITLGIEVVFKFYTKQLIFLLFTCHILAVIQIYLLLSDHHKQSKTATTIFRVHLHLLKGTLIALVFPAQENRLLPIHTVNYWFEHILLYLTPVYLISLKGSYTPEALTDIKWPIFSLAIEVMHYSILLQSITMATGININGLLCPAPGTPFTSKYYRLWVTLTLFSLNLVHTKLYVILAKGIISFLSYVGNGFANLIQKRKLK